MNYSQTLEWMFGRLPMYQKQGATAYRKDLTNTIKLAEHLKHPENKIKSIHIGGTNGKGSTSSLIASTLQEAGYKVGLYTSPHLKDFRERIKINREDIPEEYVCQFINQNKSFFEENDLSFFEMTVGLAFKYFVEEEVDFAVIEVGMGGRLDSTNIITPLISVITNIGSDHKQFLGNTFKEIATEKAGIIKPNIPAIIGEYTEETKEVFLQKATSINAPIYFASDLINETPESSLLGDYQLKNKKTALQTLKTLSEENKINITPENIINGFKKVNKNTGFRGRWDKISEDPTIICDTAHNKEGLEIVLNQISKQEFNNLHIVLGVVNDKDLEEVLPLFPKNATYYFCKPNVPRGLDEKILKEKSKPFNLTGNSYNSVNEAFTSAKLNANKNDFIYVGGSTFVVAEIL